MMTSSDAYAVNVLGKDPARSALNRPTATGRLCQLAVPHPHERSPWQEHLCQQAE